MPRTIFFLVLIVISSLSCSQKDGDKRSSGIEVEEMPQFNKEDYREVQREGVRVLIPNEMSEVRKPGGQSIMAFNHLGNEQHLVLNTVSKSTYLKSLKARGESTTDELLLEHFAKESYEDFKASVKSVLKSSELKHSLVSEQPCYTYDADVMEFGFPKSKSYVVRFYEGRRSIYTLVCWTVSEDKEKFASKVRVMGLSLQED